MGERVNIREEERECVAEWEVRGMFFGEMEENG